MPTARKQRIEYRPVDEVFPYDGNPRRNETAVKAVANSIKEFIQIIGALIEVEDEAA